MNKQSLYGLFALVVATLACSPVIAISWNEFLIIGVFVAVLLGPPLYRFVRKLEQFLKRRKED
jgi:hypothetical protein